MATPPSQITSVNIYNIDVVFDPSTGLSFGGDMPADHMLSLGQGINLIVFDLTTNPPPVPGGDVAVFLAEPMQWLGGTSPPFAQAQRYNDHRFTLVIFNTVLEAVNNEHTFNVVVWYGNTTFSSDPTIINEPPGGG